jgi:PBP4 family serine-type D-alanyl-D-alanine carboxypeptidase
MAPFVVALLSLGCSLGRDPAPPPILDLAARIAAEDPGTVLAFAAAPIDGGERWRRNATVRMHPASTLKLVTAAAAIASGALDAKFTTRLHADSKTGALMLEGGGDPLLSQRDLQALWKQANERGATLGDVVLVDSASFGDPTFGAGWMWDDEPSPYMPYVSALCVDGGLVKVTLTRPATDDREPMIAFDPPAPSHFELDLAFERTAAGTATEIEITREVLGNRRLLHFRGRLAPAGLAEATLSAPDPDLFAASTFAALAEPSRASQRPIRVVRLPRLTPEERARFVELARIDRSLVDVLVVMLKDSDNLAAECVLRWLALRENPATPATAETGVAVVARYLASLGHSPDSYTIVDGSGLSFYNSLSADLLLDVLLDMAQRGTFSSFLGMLPSAGFDGTLRRRFAGTPAEHKIAAKTGTIGGVSGLAGYTRSDDGQRAFVLLAGEYTGSARPWRDRIDAIATALVVGDGKDPRVAQPIPAPKPVERKVTLGIDVLLDGDAAPLAGQRVGLITNPSGVDGELVPTADRLHADPRFELVQLYGPEHGIRGDAYAGDAVADDRDTKTGLAVESLFGKIKRPSAATLSKLDVLVFDIQDIGSRTYTYISTLGEALHAAKEAKKKIVVLDRPNPLGGTLFEGPVIRDEWKSFIGWAAIPVTHGMTVGEIAKYFNTELGIGADLTVIPMRGWKREMSWDDTGLIWTQTSPHIPHPTSAYCYVATGMIGGLTDNINEGVGYTLPFETCAADFIDPYRFAAELARANLPGVSFVPIAYKPFYQRHSGQALRGVRLVLRDEHVFRPVETSLTLMATLEKLWPGKVKYQEGRTFNIHWGDPAVLERLKRGESARKILDAYAKEVAAFAKQREKYLLYP